MQSSKKVSKSDCQRPTTGNCHMAAQTGNNYLSGTMVDIVEIPTINSAFSTTTSSVKVSAGKCNNNGHLKIRAQNNLLTTTRPACRYL